MAYLPKVWYVSGRGLALSLIDESRSKHRRRVRFLEIAWSVYNRTGPVEAREATLGAMAPDELPGDWAFDPWRA